jgi:hypothetical protein
MATKKHFLQDRTALLLVSGNAFLALAAVTAVLLKLDAGQGSGSYITSYRPSLGIDRYTNGTIWDILSFVVFAMLIVGVSITLSYRVYTIKRELSLLVLALTGVLLTFSLVVSYSLLLSR